MPGDPRGGGPGAVRPLLHVVAGGPGDGADTVTDDYRGLFAEDTAARVEFLIKALGAAPVAGVEELG